jgi:NTP pyrophosphatase (non-canonical NTP hydrolase)
MNMHDAQIECHQNSVIHGWWDDYQGIEIDRDINAVRPGTVPPYAIIEKLALIHSEVSEALEALRERHMWTTHNMGKPEGFPSELADVLIRVFDLASALNIDLDVELREKMSFNRGRPHRHGGKLA